jgi:hypothetical protein
VKGYEMAYHPGMDADRLVHLVDHLKAQGVAPTPALRMVAAGTLPAWELPGRTGWWVEPQALEAALASSRSPDPST